MVIVREDCTGCGRCTEVCCQQALTLNEETKRAEFHKEYCVGCTACVVNCPIGALSLRDG